jgi:hypothetical protein
MPPTTGQVSDGVDDASGVVTSRPGQPAETMCKGTEEGCLPKEVSGKVPIRSE